MDPCGILAKRVPLPLSGVRISQQKFSFVAKSADFPSSSGSGANGSNESHAKAVYKVAAGMSRARLPTGDSFGSKLPLRGLFVAGMSWKKG